MFVIPIKPLSVNQVWQGRRFKTDDYKQYERDVSLFLRNVKTIRGQVKVFYKFYVSNMLADIDNCIKPLQDILVKNKVIEDDRFIIELCAMKFKVEKGMEKTEVTICGV
ncbi:MAG: RusA family crossover junction endodeoxyribonuclease [Endomicrobium sp.]|jgi:Holliday junction resolvase RusA-like endonuclease|nr:RusA family crossover junction endodeoxyribonuclease [Endomicrobium sp.]